MGSRFLRSEVTTSTIASCSLGNLCSSCTTWYSERCSSGGKVNEAFILTFCYLRAVVAAVLDDPLHLLVDELHTTQTGLLQAFHLLLHQELEGNLGHEQGGTWALGEGGVKLENIHFFSHCNEKKDWNYNIVDIILFLYTCCKTGNWTITIHCPSYTSATTLG